MTDIVALGGFDQGLEETRAIDAYTVRLTGKKRPEMLFIANASDDSEAYAEATCDIYRALGCHAEPLYLLRDPEGVKKAPERIAQADIVYVGGGNTRRMMKQWRQLGIDECLRRAAEGPGILTGMSAGAICWFEDGFSNTEIKDENGSDIYALVDGLGLLPGSLCPHFNDPPRRAFADKLARTRGYALDNCTALHVKNGECLALSTQAERRVYQVRPGSGLLRMPCELL